MSNTWRRYFFDWLSINVMLLYDSPMIFLKSAIIVLVIGATADRSPLNQKTETARLNYYQKLVGKSPFVLHCPRNSDVRNLQHYRISSEKGSFGSTFSIIFCISPRLYLSFQKSFTSFFSYVMCTLVAKSINIPSIHILSVCKQICHILRDIGIAI